MTKPQAVTSVHGNRYRLGPELGRGGQGVVFALEGGRLAVKLLRDRSAHAQEQLRDQLAMVGRLPLEGLAVARPIEQLRAPHVGYVMELFTGMQPLRSLLRPPKEMGSVAQWYFEGGGLCRRLRLLARSAEILSELHGRGLIYVDPSPHNVFVSERIDAFEVRLIDTDNLRTSGATGRSLYTRGYGAPEVVRGVGVPSSLSDSHAFAVIAFETLTLAHPLLGDSVRHGQPEMEERAFVGEVPWIDDEDDDTNRSSDGIPREIVLSETLRSDFQSTFGPGLNSPHARPGLSRWAEHLHRAADRTVTCQACLGSYYYNKSDCPWCDEPRPNFVIGAVFLWDPDRHRNGASGALEAGPGVLRSSTGKPRVVDALVISSNEPTCFTERLTHGTSRSKPTLRAKFVGKRLTLEPLDDERWHLVSSDGRRRRRLSAQPIELTMGEAGGSWIVHTGPADELHRVIRFDLRPGSVR